MHSCRHFFATWGAIRHKDEVTDRVYVQFFEYSGAKSYFREDILYIYRFWTPIEQLDSVNQAVKSVDLQKTVTRALCRPFFCILSKRSVSVTPPPFPHVCLCTPLYSQPLY